MRVQALLGGAGVQPSAPDVEAIPPSLAFLRAPEFAMPVESDVTVTSTQLAINLLSTTYAMTEITLTPTNGKVGISFSLQ